jgi:hypothetical protein
MGNYGLSKNQKRGLALLLVVGFGFLAFGFMTDWTFTLAPTGSAPLSASSLEVHSWTDGEDVSNFLPVDVYKPDPDKIEGPDDWEDLYKGISYWDEIYSGDADDFDEDLTGLSHVLIDFDPDNDTDFMRHQEIITISGNTNFYKYAYHLSSDINFNVFDVTTMGAITASGHQTDGNFTLEFQYPTYTTTELHYGSNWQTSSDDWDDMSTEEKEEYYNENNWRCQAPQYLIGEDTDNDYDDLWEKITNTYGFKFTFNTTLNETDGSVTQVNMTLEDDAPFTKVVTGEYIYLLAERTIDCEFNAYELDLELQYAANVSLSNVHSARFDVYNEESSATVESTYSAIGA